MAVCYEHGFGIAEDSGKAIDMYKTASKKGHAQAQFCMGEIVMEGKHGELKRYPTILICKENNFSIDCNYYYLNILLTGVSKDLDAALHYFQSSHKNGFKQAQAKIDAIQQQKRQLKFGE